MRSPALGYLTACPTNLGTGMRASAMMHLPAAGHLQPDGEVVFSFVILPSQDNRISSPRLFAPLVKEGP